MMTPQLEHRIANREVLHALVPFLQVFFLVWWAWMNFTWFASSYDTDDVGYRLLTLVQMAGALVLAAGVPAALRHSDYLAITVGYLVMRIGLIALWLRAAVEDRASRATALRYAAGIAGVGVVWVLRLVAVESGALPEPALFPTFLGLVALELSLPLWLERTRRQRAGWHPHHIAERYGLFAILLLGEGILAASAKVQTALARRSERRARHDLDLGSRPDLRALVALLSRACRGGPGPQPRTGSAVGLLRPVRHLREPRWSGSRPRSCRRTGGRSDRALAGRRELRRRHSGRSVPRPAVGSLVAHRGLFGDQAARRPRRRRLHPPGPARHDGLWGRSRGCVDRDGVCLHDRGHDLDGRSPSPNGHRCTRSDGWAHRCNRHRARRADSTYPVAGWHRPTGEGWRWIPGRQAPLSR